MMRPLNRDKSLEGDKKMEVAEREVEITRGVNEEDSDGQELKTDDACIPVPVVPGNHDGDDRDNHEDDFGCIPSDSNHFPSDSAGDAGIVTKTLHVKKGKRNFRHRRLAMNRISAKLRRDRKRNHLVELEEKVQALMEANEILLNKSNELKIKITEVKYKIAAHEPNAAAGAFPTTSSEVGNESQQIASGLGEMPEERPYMVAAGLTLAQNPAALAISTRSALPSFPISSDHEGFRTTTMQAHPENTLGNFTLIANNAPLTATPQSIYPAGAQLGIDFMANPMANHMINPMTMTQFPPISQQYAGIDIAGQWIHQPSVSVSSASSMFQGLNGEVFLAAPVLPMVSAGGVIHPQIGQTFMAAPASAHQMMHMGGIAPYTGPGLASNDRNHDPRGEASIFQQYINQAGKDSAHRSPRQSRLISSPKEQQQPKDGK